MIEFKLMQWRFAFDSPVSPEYLYEALKLAANETNSVWHLSETRTVGYGGIRAGDLHYSGLDMRGKFERGTCSLDITCEYCPDDKQVAYFASITLSEPDKSRVNADVFAAYADEVRAALSEIPFPKGQLKEDAKKS